ncbi:pyridoxal phosphate-dependent aminotransferase [Geoglobus acetivorans]|uniref:pyridoxal phosphate-dependent aminotransferase n=1 Tax=Geoglobus acetivorans TaxID=565033 RepID=UPI00064F1CB3
MRKTGGLQLSRERLNRRVRELKPSGIRRFFELIIGRDDVISLGVGEPDFPVPWRIREEMIYSLEKGITSYTSNYGLLELREAIADYYRRFGAEFSEENVLITTGVSEGIDLALRAVVNPGETVIVPEPVYVSYSPLAYLTGAEVVNVSTCPGFKVTYEDLVKYKDRNVKVLMLNYPNNPTGVSYTKKELEELADAVLELDCLVISDEIYAELSYSFKHVSIASLNGMEDRTIILNGFSKGFAMTGMRVGYAIAPYDILEGMVKIHQYSMLCAPVTAQVGALEALRNGEDELEMMRAEYIRRRNFFIKRLREMFDVVMPDGAFYAFPDVSSTGLSGMEFAERLLMEKNVAVVPGDAFGECGANHVRCAYAVSMEKLRLAVDRMKEFVESL